MKERGNFVRLDCIHNMWCAGCEPYKERLDREVEQGRKYKNKCNICERKWVGTEKYNGICRICASKGREEEVPQKEEKQAEKERILRHTL